MSICPVLKSYLRPLSHSSPKKYFMLFSGLMLFRVVVQSLFVNFPVKCPVVCGSLLLNTTVPWSFFHTALHVSSTFDLYVSSTSKEQGMVTQDPLRTSIVCGKMINCEDTETQDTNLWIRTSEYCFTVMRKFHCWVTLLKSQHDHFSHKMIQNDC